MKVRINNLTWEIKEIHANSSVLRYGDIIGVANSHELTIHLLKDLHIDIKRSTLIHELAHAYETSYLINQKDTYTCEEMCNFVSQFSENIIEITNMYFKDYE